MTERHGSEPRIRTAPVLHGYRYMEEAGSDPGRWKESRNGLPPSLPYVRSTRDAGREAEVAAQLAVIRAEALRRATEAFGPVPLQRRAAGGVWEPLGEEGEPA